MGYRYLVFGAGAIGTYIGGSLLNQGFDVIFLEREKDIDAIKTRGLKLSNEGQNIHIKSPQFISRLDQISHQNFDLAILSLKTYHLQDILPDLKRLKEHLPPILCLQNGVESEKILARSIGDDLVIPGTVTTAVDKNQKGDITVRRLRGMAASSNHPISNSILPDFNQAGLKLSLSSQPDHMKWSKLLINLLGNASSAILNMTPGEIYSDPILFKIELDQVHEALTAMRLLRIHPINLPGVPVKMLALAVKYFPAQLTRPLLRKMVGGGRGGKMPSFHIDLYSGRGKSEVDQLNGAIVRVGNEHNYPMPVNQTLNSILMDLIMGIQPLEEYANKPERLIEQVNLNTNL